MLYEYENVKTGEKGRVLVENEKFDTVTLGVNTERKYTTVSTTTFKRDWRKING